MCGMRRAAIALTTICAALHAAADARADDISRGRELLLTDGLQVQSLVYTHANFSSVPGCRKGRPKL